MSSSPAGWPRCWVAPRLLVSSADAPPQLKILLAGQEGLLDLLRRTQHRDLWDRITVRHHLHPLSKPATRQYVDHQVQSAGGAAELFCGEVKDLLHDYTGGVPRQTCLPCRHRQVNNLATACLLSAAASGAGRIDEAVFRDTAAEFQFPV